MACLLVQWRIGYTEEVKVTSPFRFNIGTAVMCNLGAGGWQLGRIIALHYREPHWPAETVAPYQVMLEADHGLIYVPEDDERYCRAATPEDQRIARRPDALASLDSAGVPDETRAETTLSALALNDELRCAGQLTQPGDAYRGGRCHCCDRCPSHWSYVELYSEHYRCAARNHLPVSRHVIDLGRVCVGDSITTKRPADIRTPAGFQQGATVVRLPPGLSFSDDGCLSGVVRFDPHRAETYGVEFVAVSTVHWADADIGLVRLAITMTVDGNVPPADFDMATFASVNRQARTDAEDLLDTLYHAWRQWERGRLSHRDTCEQMLIALGRLRTLLEAHPHLDGGRWWVHLGGLHMNVHKLLENTLFECELYLGFALTFGDGDVRQRAEENLKGCYQKRQLEAARFLWVDGVQHMMRHEWGHAVAIFRRAAQLKDGWGWAVNYGDIWLSEASALMVEGVSQSLGTGQACPDQPPWLTRARQLIERSAGRVDESQAFGPEGHPWVTELRIALVAYDGLMNHGAEVGAWLENFKLRVIYWCAQILGGAAPFPPKPRSRTEDADVLRHRLHAIMSRERPSS
ncbi:MAG: hypothetical protein VX589_05040 [Myxococcota bacterium]|nr:hypothetical protein [Myxococcota bacterium]